MRETAQLRRRIEKLLAQKHLDASEDEERWKTMNAGGRDMLLQKLSQYGDQVEEEISGDEAREMADFKAVLAEKAEQTKHDWLAHRYKSTVFFLPQVAQPDRRYER